MVDSAKKQGKGERGERGEKGEGSVEERLQEKLLQVEYLKAYGESIHQQLALVATTMNELSVAKEALGNLKSMKENSEILVPMGGGAYAKAKVSDTKTVLMNLGADVLADKSLDEGLAMVDSQIKKLEEARNQLNSNVTRINESLRQLAPELQELAKQVRK